MSDEYLTSQARNLLNEGNEAYIRGDARSALQKFTAVREIGQTMENWRLALQMEGAALGSLGGTYKNLGQYEEAAESHTAALEICRQLGDREEEGRSLGNLGDDYRCLGRYKEAIEMITAALVIAREVGDRLGEGANLGNLGNAYDCLGQYDEAIENHNSSLTIKREIGDRQGEGNSLGNLGCAYESLGQHKEAAKSLTAALEISREIGDRQGEGFYLRNLGLAYDNLCQYDKVIEMHTASLSITREIGDRRGEENSLRELGSAYVSLGQFDKAIDIQTASLAISQEIGDREGERTHLTNLGLAYNNLGQYDKAVKKYNAALVVSREIGDRQGEGQVLGNLGQAYCSLCRYEMAIEMYSACLPISQEIGDRQGEGANLGNLGTAFHSLGQYDEAIKYLNSSLTIKREVGDRQAEGLVLANLGNVYSDLSQYDKAIQNYTAALVISREIGDRQGEGRYLRNLGYVYESLSQYDKAIQNYTAALVISREIGDREEEGRSLGNLGSAFLHLGQLDKAIDKHTAALVISREIGDRKSEGTHLDSLGCAYSSLGQNDNAIQMHTASLTIEREIGNRQGEGTILCNLGCAYKSLGQFDKAIEMYAASLAIMQEFGNQKAQGVNLGNLGICYGCLGEHQKGIEYYKDALAISCKIGDRQGDVRHLFNLGATYFDLEQYDKAKEYLEKSITVSNAIWSDLCHDEDRITYDDGIMKHASRLLQRIYTTLGHHEEALECAERARSRAFELLLVQQRVQGGATFGESPSLPPSVADVDVSSTQELAVHQKSAIVAFSQVSESTILVWVVGSDPNQQLYSKSLHIRREEVPVMSQLVETTRRSLRAPPRKGIKSGSPSPPHNAASLAHPSVDEDELYASVARSIELVDGTNPTQEQVQGAFAPLASDEDGLGRAHGNLLLNEQKELQREASKKLLRQCYNILIEPVLPGLLGESQLIIIPDRDLYGLPFAALLSQDEKYLIESFSVRIAPSIGTIVELEKRAAARKVEVKELSALVVGDPNFNEWLNQLESARKEARDIVQLMNGTPCTTTLLEFNDAGKERVKSTISEFDIVHLATHGTKDGIFLSGDTMEEGMLHMAEVQELNLNRTKLVVLSACDTFKGELRADGVIGIARAFVAAGASTLLATLWKVDDKSTHELMKRFYQEIFTDIGRVVDVELALRNTMISMIRDGFSAHEWAPFVIYGLSVDFAPWTVPGLSVDFAPRPAPGTKSKLEVELEDLLVSSCRLPPELIGKGMVWCKMNDIDQVGKILAQHKEEDFFNALCLRRNPRKRVLLCLKKIEESL